MSPQEKCYHWLENWRELKWEIKVKEQSHKCWRRGGQSKCACDLHVLLVWHVFVFFVSWKYGRQLLKSQYNLKKDNIARLIFIFSRIFIMRIPTSFSCETTQIWAICMSKKYREKMWTWSWNTHWSKSWRNWLLTCKASDYMPQLNYQLICALSCFWLGKSLQIRFVWSLKCVLNWARNHVL